MANTPIALRTPSGLTLEGRLSTPEGTARGGAVVCHPHPVYGGTMSTSVVPTICRALVAEGWAALRFNFRGVGASGGAYDGGRGEAEDAGTALAHVAALLPDAPLAVLGWSFGALVALHAAIAEPRVGAYVAGAPPLSVRARIDVPVLPDPDALRGFRARVLGVCGTGDEFCHPNDLSLFISQISSDGRVEVVEGADHLFTQMAARRQMAGAIAAFVARG